MGKTKNLKEFKIAPQPVIELDQVTFAYERVPVLSKVSFSVYPGEFLGIIGPNGSGKSTLLRLMAGLLRPQNGRVLLFGKPIEKARKIQQRIGYVSQMTQQLDRNTPMTVAEMVAMGRTLKKGIFHHMGVTDWHVVEQSLAAVDLSHTGGKAISELSIGQQQRVFIARALAQEPQILLLDEPTSGMDDETQVQFYQLLQDLNRGKQLTVVFISHDRSAIASHASRLVYANKTLVDYGSAMTKNP